MVFNCIREPVTDLNLTQIEADALIAVEKHGTGETEWRFALPGDRLTIPLISADKREGFFLDVTRSEIKLTKATFQNRVRQSVILRRLDIAGPPH